MFRFILNTVLSIMNIDLRTAGVASLCCHSYGASVLLLLLYACVFSCFCSATGNSAFQGFPYNST